MMHFIVSTAVVASVVSGCAAQGPTVAQAPQPFRLVVTVQNGANMPIASVGVGFLRNMYRGQGEVTANGKGVGVRTGPDGTAEFSGELSTSPLPMFVGLVQMYSSSDAGPTGPDAERAARVALLSRWGFARRMAITLIGGQQSQALSLTGTDARCVCANVVQNNQSKSWKDVFVCSGDWTTASDSGTTPSSVRIAGLPRYQPSLITLGADHRTAVVAVPALPAVAAGESVPSSVPDADLGSIALGDPNSGTPLTATITTPTEFEAKSAFSWIGATFVRQDGQMLCHWYRHGVTEVEGPEMRLVSEAPARTDTLPRLPAGTYYILPGPWAGTDRQWHFLKLLRANALPASHGVPTITIAEGQASASVTIDPEPIDAALKSLLSTQVPSSP